MATGRILLVDDDQAVLGLVQALVGVLGFSTDTARSATAALQQLETATFDAVISDIEMPEMTGLELTDQIRNRWPELPIILMTGGARPRAATDPILIRKPFTLEQLRVALAQVLPQSGV